MDYGIQLYSVRDLAEKNLEEAVSRVAALGYSSVILRSRSAKCSKKTD